MSTEPLPKMLGELPVMYTLAKVKPNAYNPNGITQFEKDALKQGMLKDGWIAAQALLVWRRDDKGVKRNIIIDGENRWAAAVELGFTKGPMVFLDGLPEHEAKALTIKLNARRGKSFKDEPLAVLLKELQSELIVPDLSMEVGIPTDELMRLMAFDAAEIALPGASPDAPAPSDRQGVHARPDAPNEIVTSHVAMVQLFFGKDDHAEFLSLVKRIGAHRELKNPSQTCLAVLRDYAGSLNLTEE